MFKKKNIKTTDANESSFITNFNFNPQTQSNSYKISISHFVVFKNENYGRYCCCKTINFNFLYVALKHSPSKRKSLSRVAQRSTEADSDSHRKY